MPGDVVRTFDDPDERTEFELGHVDLISLGALMVAWEVLEPGWRWSTHVRPIVGTERCERRHVGYQVSGNFMNEARDGTLTAIGPGQVYDLLPGHDAWVVGEEASVCLTFQGSAEFAAPKGAGKRILATLLFSDIVGSTTMAAALGDDRWRLTLREHLEDVNLALGDHRGALVDTAGDGVLARFDSPADALHAALVLQQAARRRDLDIRVGIHTTEVELVNGAVRGVGVHLAARVMGEARPGQVVVTATTRDLASGAGFAFAELGTFELKGIPGPRTLYAVVETA